MPATKTLVMMARTLSPPNSRRFSRSPQDFPRRTIGAAAFFRSPCCRAETDLLILKLTIVPLALLVFGIVERLHGPRVAGWLAGFPIVGGPLLLFVTLDHGLTFGSQAALGAYFGLVPWLAFTMSYAFCSRRLNWFWSMVISFAIWTLVALLAIQMQEKSRWLDVVPFASFVGAQFAYPRAPPSDEEREHVWWGQPARM